jgi:hypothetical protein
VELEMIDEGVVLDSQELKHIFFITNYRIIEFLWGLFITNYRISELLG